MRLSLRINTIKPLIRMYSGSDRSMNYIFTQKFNPMSGQIEWQKQLQDYDFLQALARSSYADMVNDSHRNALYFKAIQKSVNALKTTTNDILGLDIGTGTGLLSMMAIKSGANRVVACDSFEPIAKCAQNIVHKNGFSDSIKVKTKRSNDLTVGSDCDLDRRADLLVAELFDTELIGEGAIPTYRHSVEHLLKSDALLVPSRARIYCQLVESQSLFLYHQFRRRFQIDDKISIESPESVNSCRGSNILHDIQMNELKPNEDFVIISEPKVVFEFEFNDLTSLKPKDNKVIEFKAIRDTTGPLVLLMWWDSDMDFEGEYVLSCAPFWTYNDSEVSSKSIAWRDHWMQSIYYFSTNPKQFELKSNEILKVEANRDEYSLWFNESNDDKQLSHSTDMSCKCGLHLFLSRTRMAMINDMSRLQRYNKAFESFEKSLKCNSINAIFVGDSSLLPIIAAKYSKIEKVFCLVRNKQSEDFITSYSKCNGCDHKIEIIQDFDRIEDNSIGLVFGEPYFNTSDLPWNHLHFWHLLHNIPSNILSKDVVLMPNRARIKAIPIEFDNLWKIHSEVGSNVEGFDLSIYDSVIQNAMALSDASIESQPLWEYPGKAIAERPIELYSFDLRRPVAKQGILKSLVKFDISSNLDKLNTKYISIAFWVEFYLLDHLIENSGPIEPISNGDYVVWNRHYRQGVTFLPNIDVLNKEKLLTFSTTFDAIEGEFECHLDL